jgi:hypothetical protein
MMDAVQPRFRVSICAVAYEPSMPRIVRKKNSLGFVAWPRLSLQ